jgi:hypothetical protein
MKELPVEQLKTNYRLKTFIFTQKFLDMAIQSNLANATVGA